MKNVFFLFAGMAVIGMAYVMAPDLQRYMKMKSM